MKTDVLLKGGPEALKKRVTNFAIRARFVGGAPPNLESAADGHGIYLGKRGQWASREKALIFRSTDAAESALQEKWSRLHNAGDKSVILSVVRV